MRIARLAIAGALLILAGVSLWLAGSAADAQLIGMLRLADTSPLTPAMRLVSRIGGLPGMGPLSVAVVIALAFRGRTGAAIWLLVTVASGRIVVELIKDIVARARPELSGQLVDVHNLSMPSAHSAGSMLTGVAIVLALRLRWPWLAVAVGWSLVVGVSRVLLGVHWPSDVLAGWGFGLLWASAASRWLPER